MADKLDARVALRLTGDDLGKVEQIAALRRCTLSEAVRLMISGTKVTTVSTSVVEISAPSTNNLVMA